MKRKRARPTYYAVSALGRAQRYSRSGNEYYTPDWHLLAGPFASRQGASDAAEAKISRSNHPHTLASNLVIVPKSKLRKYYIDIDEYFSYDS